MRVDGAQGAFRVRAIAGTRVVLLAIDCAEADANGLLGFAVGSNSGPALAAEPKWLPSTKVFKSVVPDPRGVQGLTTHEHPVQSFLWSDYALRPDTEYRYTIVPMYGTPAALQPAPAVVVDVRTEREFADGHGVWFNRGAVASQAFSRKFANKAPANPNDPADPETSWLARGLLDACLTYIDDAAPGDGLRVAAYEFTYPPVLDALKRALDRGVDVRIVYHDTTGETGSAKNANEDAIQAAGLPQAAGGQQVLFPRANTKIPHNKFIVRIEGGAATRVWTGSTNFTPSGFLGQTNVGHRIDDPAVADVYRQMWEALRDDPEQDAARQAATSLTAEPPELPGPGSTLVFSPRPTARVLKWYGRRMEDATGQVMFTAAFGVSADLIPSLTAAGDHLRFILMEKPPTAAVAQELAASRDVVFSYGAVLGEMYRFNNQGEPVARQRIPGSELEKWFLREDHYRPHNDGFVFFVHAKFLLVDPLGDDPLVCTGSANFSRNSVLDNDENMVLIRGNTRVADIYLTEFDRIYRHFHSRDVENELEAKGVHSTGPFLEETDRWTAPFFKAGNFKARRREMFFAPSSPTWADNAGAR